MIVDSGISIRSAAAPANGAIAIPAMRPHPPAQPIPLERISGGYDSVARLLIPVCPPTWVKFHADQRAEEQPAGERHLAERVERHRLDQEEATISQ
jgi:hypothetical protein